jgi:hypothetical protein
MHEPFELSSAQIAKLPGMGGSLDLESFKKAQAGEVWEAWDGRRLLYILGVQCVYILEKPYYLYMNRAGKVYQQHRTGLTRDIVYSGYASDVARRTSATKTVIKAHVEFMIGVAKAVSTPVKIADYGLSAVEWLARHNDDIPKWIRIIEVVWEIKDVVQTNCPTLYNKVIQALFPTELPPNYDPPIFHRGAGNLFGKFGQEKVEIHVDVLKDLLKHVLMKIVTHVVMTNASLSHEQCMQLGVKVAENLRGRVQLSDKEKADIAAEVGRSASKIQGSLIKLQGALESN